MPFDASELEKIQAEVKSLGIELDRLSESSLDEMSDILIGWARSRFLGLSAGQSVDGYRWSKRKKLDSSSRPIGILTRRLISSIEYSRPKTVRRGVHRRILRFAAPHNHLFDELRKLLPKKLPPRVFKQLTEILNESLARMEGKQ